MSKEPCYHESKNVRIEMKQTAQKGRHSADNLAHSYDCIIVTGSKS